MDRFAEAIAKSLRIEGKRLSIVKSPDGFLLRPDTQEKVRKAVGLLLLPINSTIELRVRYELYDKDSQQEVCYVDNGIGDMMPDIQAALFNAGTLHLSDLMPSLNETRLRSTALSYDMAAYLYHKKYTYNLSVEQTKAVLAEAKQYYGEDINKLEETLHSIQLDWTKVETMEAICGILLKAISQGQYEKLEPAVNELNEDFQKFVDKGYFGLASSSPIIKPKMVNKVLPFLTYKHTRRDKVALIVVDGMSYWQYKVLEKELKNKGLAPHNDITMAWLPSITKLSRQAIFRGDMPRFEYQQNPKNEGKLWTEYWTSQRRLDKKLNDFEIEYAYKSFEASDTNKVRLACVDIDLDEKMHSSSHFKDLYDLTCNWATATSEGIANLHEQGFTVYITTDHGNIMAHPWRKLTSQEKTFLYQRDSRGSRYLTYLNTADLRRFLSENEDIEKDLLVHDNWAVWRTSRCFDSENEITHGGSHFLEVVIPFITID